MHPSGSGSAWSPSSGQGRHEDGQVDDGFEPLFKNNSETNITVQAGSDSAFLPCRVKNLGEHVVSFEFLYLKLFCELKSHLLDFDSIIT